MKPAGPRYLAILGWALFLLACDGLGLVLLDHTLQDRHLMQAVNDPDAGGAGLRFVIGCVFTAIVFATMIGILFCYPRTRGSATVHDPESW